VFSHGYNLQFVGTISPIIAQYLVIMTCAWGQGEAFGYYMVGGNQELSPECFTPTDLWGFSRSTVFKLDRPFPQNKIELIVSKQRYHF
jgi:hypothetical protein